MAATYSIVTSRFIQGLQILHKKLGLKPEQTRLVFETPGMIQLHSAVGETYKYGSEPAVTHLADFDISRESWTIVPGLQALRGT